MYIITLYIEDGDKVHLDYPTKEKAFEIAEQMKANDEVFSIGKVEDDNSITEINF